MISSRQLSLTVLEHQGPQRAFLVIPRVSPLWAMATNISGPISKEARWKSCQSSITEISWYYLILTTPGQSVG